MIDFKINISWRIISSEDWIFSLSVDNLSNNFTWFVFFGACDLLSRCIGLGFPCDLIEPEWSP